MLFWLYNLLLFGVFAYFSAVYIVQINILMYYIAVIVLQI